MIGVGYTGVKLSDNSGGTGFTFRNELGLQNGVMKIAGRLQGMPATEAVEMAMSVNLAEASLGVATINAVLNRDFEQGENALEVIDLRPEDVVGMVGYFFLWQNNCRKVSKLYIFEKKLTEPELLPDWAENIYLPQ